MTHARTLIVFLLLGGCTSPSLYEQAAENLTKMDGLVSHAVKWVSARQDSDKPLQAVLASCVEKLGKHPYANALNESIATLQLVDCMEQRGWRLELTEEVVVQQKEAGDN